VFNHLGPGPRPSPREEMHATSSPHPLLLDSLLRAAVGFLPDAVAGEAWLCGETGTPTVAAFFAPTPLRATLPQADGRPPLYATVDLPLVRAHSARHQLSTALAARAAAARAPQVSCEIGADEMLRKLTFDVDTAVAVPLVEGGDAGGRCEAVLVLFTFRGGGGVVRGG